MPAWLWQDCSHPRFVGATATRMVLHGAQSTKKCRATGAAEKPGRLRVVEVVAQLQRWGQDDWWPSYWQDQRWVLMCLERCGATLKVVAAEASSGCRSCRCSGGGLGRACSNASTCRSHAGASSGRCSTVTAWRQGRCFSGCSNIGGWSWPGLWQGWPICAAFSSSRFAICAAFSSSRLGPRRGTLG